MSNSPKDSKQASDTVRLPSWWSDSHDSAWERVKEAMKRDWEQTKADFSKKSGHELNQNAADTVLQATGAEPVPPGSMPNLKTGESVPSPSHEHVDFHIAEPALRYGYAAELEYEKHFKEWDESLEGKMRKEWEELYPHRSWEAVRHDVRLGYDAARRKM